MIEEISLHKRGRRILGLPVIRKVCKCRISCTDDGSEVMLLPCKSVNRAFSSTSTSALQSTSEHFRVVNIITITIMMRK